jgi:phosphoribosylformylglycinamidine synthase
VTDNLNFGNPYKPENFWQLREAVEGVAEACRVFGTPVTGGNVSLYNENPAGVVDPTPTIGMVGLIDREEHITTQWFKNDGDVIMLIGRISSVAADAPGRRQKSEPTRGALSAVSRSLGGSRYFKVCYGLKVGPPPQIDLANEIKVQNAVRDLIRQGLLKSAHDCSEGGLAVALAECCFNQTKLFGAEIDLKSSDLPAVTLLFNESQSRIVVSVAPENLRETIATLQAKQIPFLELGRVGGERLRIRVHTDEFSWPVRDLYDDWWNAIRRAVAGDSAAEGIPSL